MSNQIQFVDFVDVNDEDFLAVVREYRKNHSIKEAATAIAGDDSLDWMFELKREKQRRDGTYETQHEANVRQISQRINVKCRELYHAKNLHHKGKLELNAEQLATIAIFGNWLDFAPEPVKTGKDNSAIKTKKSLETIAAASRLIASDNAAKLAAEKVRLERLTEAAKRHAESMVNVVSAHQQF